MISDWEELRGYRLHPLSFFTPEIGSLSFLLTKWGVPRNFFFAKSFRKPTRLRGLEKCWSPGKTRCKLPAKSILCKKQPVC